MRFATKLEFGDKTHEVTMTAQRLVQRMMKDSIHSGRRPSGLCGAALLIAARMHDYSRTPMDIVRIVKIHESTLRKRLIEFGDTPSSMLTLDEFMAVDLEAEQDPPAFKAARKRDKERLQRLPDHEAELTDLQREIDHYLDQELRRNSRKRRFDPSENEETDKFIRSSTLDVISECIGDNADESKANGNNTFSRGIAPDIAAMCAPTVEYKMPAPTTSTAAKPAKATTSTADADTEQTEEENCELDIEGLDDNEIEGYIMTEDESKYKDEMWNKLNADYLREAKAKEERLAREREEGKPEKKKRRVNRKKNIGPSSSAGEAIEKMLQEKKISSKINYDILKSLTSTNVDADENEETRDEADANKDTSAGTDLLSRYVYIYSWIIYHIIDYLLDHFDNCLLLFWYKIHRNTKSSLNAPKSSKLSSIGLPVAEIKPETSTKVIEEDNGLYIDMNIWNTIVWTCSNNTKFIYFADEDDYYDDDEVDEEPESYSLARMLNNRNDDDYYGYEDSYD